MSRRRFVILDRDGTVIVERHYLSNPDGVELIPGAAAGLRRMREMGLGLVIATNQSALGRGFFDRSRLDRIHQRVLELLGSEGVRLDGIYVCPHLPEDRCLCRKPRAGLVEQAARELGFEPHTSFIIGDKACDIELGQELGATTLLVRTGYGARVAQEQHVVPDYVVAGLEEAAHVITQLCAATPAPRRLGVVPEHR